MVGEVWCVIYAHLLIGKQIRENKRCVSWPHFRTHWCLNRCGETGKGQLNGSCGLVASFDHHHMYHDNVSLVSELYCVVRHAYTCCNVHVPHL